LITETITEENLKIRKEVEELKDMLSILMGVNSPKPEKLRELAKDKKKIVEEARKHGLVTKVNRN